LQVFISREVERITSFSLPSKLTKSIFFSKLFGWTQLDLRLGQFSTTRAQNDLTRPQLG